MYKVTIQEIRDVDVVKQGQYCVLETRSITADEREEMCNRVRGYENDDDRAEGRNEIEKYKLDKTSGMYVKNIYGNAPSTTVTEQKTTEVFSQVVDTLNIPAVICAINAIN